MLWRGRRRGLGGVRGGFVGVQAEDGRRDGQVNGGETWALPIFNFSFLSTLKFFSLFLWLYGFLCAIVVVSRFYIS